MNAYVVKTLIARGNDCYIWHAVWQVDAEQPQQSVHGVDKTLEDALTRAQRAIMNGLLQNSEVR